MAYARSNLETAAARARPCRSGAARPPDSRTEARNWRTTPDSSARPAATTLTSGMTLEDNQLPLTTWFLAIRLPTVSETSMSTQDI